MKNVGLFFLIAFLFFFIGQVLWTIALIIEVPLFDNQQVEDWVINTTFTLCSIFGLIGGVKLYQQK